MTMGNIAKSIREDYERGETMNKRYARTNYSNRDFITAGKLYLVKKYDGDNFEITGDGGEWVYCGKLECHHLDGSDWEIIEEKEQMNVLTGKQGMQTSVMDWAEDMKKAGWWVDVTTRIHCDYVIAFCGNGSAARKLEARGDDMVTALIELMKGWEAIYGEAAELDREWKAFVDGLPDGVQAWRYDDDGRHHAVVVGGEGGDILKISGKDEAATKRGLMAAWAAINNE